MTNWKKVIKATIEKIDDVFSESRNVHELNLAKNKIIGKNSLLLITFKNFSTQEKKNYSEDLKKIKVIVREKYQKYLQKLNFGNDDAVVQPIHFHQHKKWIVNQKGCFNPIDAIEPKFKWQISTRHPIEKIINNFHQFANKMGWKYVTSKEINNLENNFDLLNIGKEHPARSINDCFYLNNNQVLRTHATNMTALELQKYGQDPNSKPRKVYTVGNVYRNDTDDATHLPQFHQIDVCLIGDKNYSMANLKWILKKICQFLFDESVQIRFRTSYFPFTQPSLELDIGCLLCKQKGCHLCENSGWIELLGAGIIHQQVLKNCGIKNLKTVALAFGIGVERIAMLKYHIKDIRYFKNEFFQTKLVTKK